MNLKIDFIKAITTSIIDRNKRDCFLKVKNEKISSKQSVPTLTNSPNFDSLKEKEKTFFDLLITNNGLYSVCDWLLLKCISNNNVKKQINLPIIFKRILIIPK